MSTSKSQLLANARYRENNIERVVVEIRKGKKEEYKQAASAREIGLMELFRRGADEYIQNHQPIKKQ